MENIYYTHTGDNQVIDIQSYVKLVLGISVMLRMCQSMPDSLIHLSNLYNVDLSSSTAHVK